MAPLQATIDFLNVNFYYKKGPLDLQKWTQIRYLQTAPLPALKDPDPHNWSTKGRANT
jgi:hypothetical protein